MPVTRKRYFDYTVTLDEQPVHLLIKRLTAPEFEEFQAKFIAMSQGRGSPVVVTDHTHLTREDLDAEVAYLKANAEWLQEVFDRYVTVVPGCVFDEGDDGRPIPVTNGRQFADMFGGSIQLSHVLAQIWLENKLSADQKKKLLLASDSATGSSTAPATAAAGETPAPTASSAEPETSVDRVAAMAPSNGGSSGMTAH